MGTNLRQTYILGLVAVIATSLVAGCGSSPTTFSPNNTDRFVNNSEEFYSQASQILAGDYLFVLDTSYSMESKKDDFVSTMQTFADSLENKKIDFQIGFLLGNYQAPTSTTAIPSTLGQDFITDLLTSWTDQSKVDEILESIGQPLSANRPVPLESAYRLMKDKGTGFVRKGAQLVYVFLTDADDRSNDTSLGGASNRTPTFFADKLKAHKSNSAYVSARAITAGGAGCAVQSGDVDGARIRSTASLLNAASGGPSSYCVYSPANITLGTLAQDVSKTTNRFQLLGVPVETPIVKIQGTTIPQTGHPTYEWSYKPSTNEVVFVSGKAPGNSEQLQIIYEIKFVLSRTPNTDSIQVTVNGQTIAKNGNNGWTYESGENRILFHGSSKPKDGAEVLISYVVN